MGEITFIVQSGQPGGYKQNQRQKQINSHVAKFVNGRRVKALATLKQSNINQCLQLEDTTEIAESESPNAHKGSREREQTSETWSDARTRSSFESDLIKPCPSPAGGSLDQFGSFVFPRNLRTDCILHFWDWFIITPSINELQSGRFRKDAWSLTLSAFTDHCRGYAFMSSAAHLHSITTGDPASAILAKKFRTLSMANLRWRLSRDGLSRDAIASVLALITAELSHGDSEAAATHIRYLKQYVQPLNKVDKFGTPGGVHILLWQEIQRASRTLTRPILDLERWRQENSPGLWLPKSASLRDLLDAQSTIDIEAATDPRFLGLLTEAKKYGVLLHVMTETHAQISRDNSLRLSTSLLLLNGRLLEYYLDQLSHNISPLSRSSLNVFTELQAAAAALASMFWLRVITRDEVHMPVVGYESSNTMFNATCTILAELERLLRLTETTAQALLQDHQVQQCKSINRSHSSPIPPPLRLRLWILHVGVYIEASRQSFGTARYHQVEMQKLVSALDMHDNDTVYRATIQWFLPIDKHTTLAPTWFMPIFRTVALAYDRGDAAPSVQSWEVQCLLHVKKMSSQGYEQLGGLC